MYNIRYSEQASRDIEDAISYIATESKTNALDYLSRYEEKIDLLKFNPYMGVDCKNKLIKRDCRILVHESHIVIYKVLEDTNEVYLIRIIHSSADYTHSINNEKNHE